MDYQVCQEYMKTVFFCFLFLFFFCFCNSGIEPIINVEKKTLSVLCLVVALSDCI